MSRLAEMLRAYLDSERADIHTSIPARVERYDATTGLADCAPLLRRGFVTAEGERDVEDIPVIVDVPIVFPGAGGYRLTMPVTVGDVVGLLFTESALERWLKSDGEAVDPGDDRRHSLSDAIAIPGLYTARTHPTASTTKLVLGKVGGPSIEIDSSTIDVGGTSALALKQDLEDLRTAIGNAVPGAADGGAALVTSLLGLWSGPTGTTVTRGG